MGVLQMFFSVRWEVAAASLGAMVSVVAMLAGLRAMFFSRPSDVVERLERTVGRADGAERSFEREQSGRTLARVLQPLSWIVRPTKAAELSRLRSRLVQAGLRGQYTL